MAVADTLTFSGAVEFDVIEKFRVHLRLVTAVILDHLVQFGSYQFSGNT